MVLKKYTLVQVSRKPFRTKQQFPFHKYAIYSTAPSSSYYSIDIVHLHDCMLPEQNTHDAND